MRFALLLLLWAGSAQSGVAAYDACLSEGYETRVMETFALRFPHETCRSRAECDAKLMQSAEALTRAQCRAIALDDCASTKCRLGLKGRWRADGEVIRADVEDALARVDLATLPRLQARRLGDPERWLSPVTCLGDAITCDAERAGQALGDYERLANEVRALQ
ncbi:MAG: hypothetical protein AAGA15_16055 [Pseudomonadota bacterium]